MGIEVKIGRYEMTYLVYKTQAPEEYDGFGTLEIAKSGEMRYVVIKQQHEDWQIKRYASGRFGAQKIEEPTLVKMVEDKLLNRIIKFQPASSNFNSNPPPF